MQNPFADLIPQSQQQAAVVVGTPRAKPGQAVDLARDEVGLAIDRNRLAAAPYDARKAAADARKAEIDADKAAREAASGGASLDREAGLRKEFASLQSVKDYTAVLPQYSAALRAEDTKAGDLNLIYAFGKIMDPGSVVREGELTLVQNTGTIGDRLRGLLSEVNGNGRLSPQTRKALLMELRTRGSAIADAYNQSRRQYRQLAERAQISPELIVGPHPGLPHQQAEADFLGRPIRNLDGTQGAAPQRVQPLARPEVVDETRQGLLSQDVAIGIMERMIAEGADYNAVASFLNSQKLQFDPDQLETAVNVGRAHGLKGESTGLGIVEGMLNPIDRAAEFLQNTANSVFGTDFSTASQVNDARDQYFRENPTSEGGKLIGNALTLGLGTARLGPVAAGAISGALGGDSTTAEGVATDAVVGAIGGKAADSLTNLAARAIAPRLTDEVRTLANEGVQMTPGQIVGGKLKNIEDRATSYPLVQDRINARRQDGIDSFNRAAYDRALKPAGITLPKEVKTGHQAIGFIREKLGNGYNQVMPKVTVELDQTFVTRMNAIRQRANLPEAQAAELEGIFQREIGGAFTPGQGRMTGRDYKLLDERLTDIAEGYLKSDNPYERLLGSSVDKMREQMAAIVRRQNPNVAGRLRQLDKGYANYVRLRRAAAKSPKDGVVTPAQLNAAVRESDTTLGKGATARGEALMQDLAAAGQEVLPSAIGNSGTTDRANLTDPVAWGTGLLLSPFYSNGAQNAFQGLALAGRGPASELIANALRYLPAAPAGGVGLGMLTAPQGN